MEKTDASKIIDFLDGPTAVAKLFGISAPSVHQWRTCGIPDDKLIRLAPMLEARKGSKWTRRSLFPREYGQIWPELARAARKAG